MFLDEAKGYVVMTQQTNKQKNLYVVGGVLIVAVVAFIAVILIAQNVPTSTETVDKAGLFATRNSDGSFIIGNEDAPITFIVFSNYFCGFCQRYAETVDRMIEEFVSVGKARVEHRVLGNSPDSIVYAQLTECVATLADPLIAWDAMDHLFRYAQPPLRLSGSDATRQLATDMDLNYARLLECTATSRQYQVDGRFSNSAAISGTPAVRVRLAGEPLSVAQIIGSQEGGGVDFAMLEQLVEQANR